MSTSLVARRVAALGATLALALALTAVGCAERATFTIGGECVRNTDCDDPLVCRYGRCRVECYEDIDCGIGLECYRDVSMPDLSGGCQLEEENDCALDSACPEELVCKFGGCTFECVEDRDCAPGSACVLDDGVLACVSTNDACIYNSDCPEPLVCDSEQVCRLECRLDRDCIAPRTCDPLTYRCVL